MGFLQSTGSISVADFLTDDAGFNNDNQGAFNLALPIGKAGAALAGGGVSFGGDGNFFSSAVGQAVVNNMAATMSTGGRGPSGK